MSAGLFPSEIYKANVELQQRAIELLQESGRNWVVAVQQFGKGGLSDPTAQIGDRLRTADWQSLTTLSSEAFWPAFRSRLNDVQAANQIALRNQISFATGLQQALRNWHETVFEAFGTALEAGDLFTHWGAPWPQAVTTDASKAEK